MSGIVLLIVDDEAEIRELIASVARRGQSPTKVHLAASAPEAIHLLRTERVDAMITDVRMPGRSGVELLREVEGMGLDVRCALMTGFQEDVIDGVALADLQVIAVLRKPFRLPELVEVLRRLEGAPSPSPA